MSEDTKPAQLATSRCIFGHRWTMWELTKAINQADETVVVQSRRCVRCGKIEVESIRT